MDNGFNNRDTRSPAVEEVEVIIGNLEECDERIVAECEKDRGDQVERGQSSGASSQRGDGRLVVEHLVW